LLDGTADEDALLLEQKCSGFVSGLFCGDSGDLSFATGTSRIRLHPIAAKHPLRAKSEFCPLSTGIEEDG
jgi:hypothetical protein